GGCRSGDGSGSCAADADSALSGPADGATLSARCQDGYPAALPGRIRQGPCSVLSRGFRSYLLGIPAGGSRPLTQEHGPVGGERRTTCDGDGAWTAGYHSLEPAGVDDRTHCEPLKSDGHARLLS